MDLFRIQNAKTMITIPYNEIMAFNVFYMQQEYVMIKKRVNLYSHF